MNSLPWFDIAIAGTQAFIALSLLLLTYKQHSTQVKVQRALKVHEWGNECIDLLVEAERFCLVVPNPRGDWVHAEDKDELLRRLSAAIDRGRMFFRNKQQEDFGQYKRRAFRGLRPAILDPLVAAYMAIEAIDHPSNVPDVERQERLWEWRREFVSVLQDEIHDEWLKRATKYEEKLGGGAGDSIDSNSEAPPVT